MESEQVQWDMVVGPNRPHFTLGLAEIWRYRDLLYLFTRRDIVSFYKQTVLGPLWIFIQPIFTTLIFVLVFGQIAKLSTDGAPQIVFYMCGVTFWNYFSDCLNKTSTIFRDNANLFGKVYFPRVITPVSIVLANLVRLVVQLLLFLFVWGWCVVTDSVSPNLWILLLPFTIMTLALLSLSFGMLFSALTTKYRDMVFVLQFGVQLLMYASPVIYPASQMPTGISSVLSWNPLVPLFEVTRFGFLGVGSFTLAGLLYSLSFAISALLVSYWIFNRVERTFMDTV